MPSRVLIVDDHAGFRALARRMLEAAGWDVIGEAETAAAGVAAAGELHPDVVLLDLNLPDGSGLDVTGSLAEHATVVLTSTHEEAELEELALRRGASGFVPKSQLTGATLAAAAAAG